MSESNGKRLVGMQTVNLSETIWPCRRLEETSEINGGVTLGRDPRGRTTRNVPYMRVANVKDGRLDLSDVKTTPATEEEIAALRLKVGDILLTEGGDPDKLGRGTFWRGEIPECVHQNHIFRVRFDPSHFDPAFVAYQFGSAYGKAYFAAHAKQTTGIATINRRVLGAFPLLTPPLEEQRRIAQRLHEELGAAAKARADLEAQLAAAKALPASYLRSVFQSTEAQYWPRKRLDEVALIVNGYGFSESLQGRKDLPFPFVKVSDMNARGAESIITTAANTVDEALLRQLRARTYPAGTVIFPKVGGALLTNKKRVLGVEATFDNNIMGVVPREVESEWIYRWAQTIDLRTLANVQALPSIRQSDVAALEIPMPPLDTRRAIAARLEAESFSATRLCATLAAKFMEVEKLPAALLRAAFQPCRRLAPI